MSDTTLVRIASMPAVFTSFVDRRAQLTEARARLGSTRLLTVVGPAGVGKTRFAVRLAQLVSRHYQDDIWFIDLSVVPPGGSVADQAVTQLGLESAADRDQEAIVASFFAGRGGLLVLDNCEHVIEGALSLIVRLVAACPELTIVATSRESFRLSYESLFLLDPLDTLGDGGSSMSAAVSLFLDRRPPQLPEPTREELEDIREICRRLEGLPLAIELAATRMLALSARQILDRLDAPLGFLTRGPRDIPDRQQSITAAIAWSYGLCTEDERSLWRRMAVFTGGWDLASAEAVCAERAESEDVLDTIQALIEKSIVQSTPTGDGVVVYTMLDAMRRFGVEMTPADELRQTRRAHRDWYVRRLQDMESDWYGPNQFAWLALARRELPNIRAAIDFSIERGEADTAAALLVPAWRVVWQAHGRFDELRRWALKVLGMGEIDTPMLCQLLIILGGIESAGGDRVSGTARLDQAAVIADGLGDIFTLSAVPGMRAAVDPDVESGIALYEESLAMEGGHTLYMARSNAEERLALAYDRAGRTEQALALRTALVRRAVRAGDVFETSYLLMWSGIIACARGEFDNASSLLRQSLSLKQGMDNPAGLAQVEEALARVAVLGDDFSRAACLLGAAHTIWDAAGANNALFPQLVGPRSEVEAAARAALGARAYAAAFARGQAFSVDDGIAYALGAQLHVSGQSASSGAPTTLSARERQVAALVGQGMSDREIADILVISRRTAEGHVARSLMKLGFTSRAQLAAWTVGASTGA